MPGSMETHIGMFKPALYKEDPTVRLKNEKGKEVIEIVSKKKAEVL